MKLNIRGVEFFSFKPYEQRMINRISQGVHEHITERGRIYFHESYYNLIKTSPTYSIRFKNKNPFPVDVELELSTYDKTGRIDNTFRENRTYLKPGETGGIYFRLPDKGTKRLR